MDSKYAKNIKKTLNISIKKADLLWNIYLKKIKKAQKKEWGLACIHIFELVLKPIFSVLSISKNIK
jgi:hypothetical protein